ncbi:MAG: hypothetical protein LIP09_00845 [Bacteroidales bacterium]|nr:hypothetical protein [Bacteroidales bacterium]
MGKNVNFEFNEAKDPQPVRIEQVYAEKPGGGRVKEADWDIPATTAVYQNSDGTFSPIKAYRLADAALATDTEYKIEKGSGVAVGDFIGTGEEAKKAEEIDASEDDYDLVTLTSTLGVALAKGAVLYQAKEASAAAVAAGDGVAAKDAVLASPVGTPVYVTGNDLPAGKGDLMVRLINGANLRKETANIASEVAALLPTIQLV